MVETDYTRRLERVLQVCRTLPGPQQVDDYLQQIVETTAELVQSESCSILLYDKEQRCLRFVAALPGQLATLKNLGVPVDRSVAGWVYTHSQPFKLNHADGDERIFRVVDREISDETRSLLAVPMNYQGKTIGVLEAINKFNKAHYTEEDLLILETLASQAAFAVQSAQMLDVAQHSHQRLMEIEQLKSDWVAILSQDLRAALQTILGQAAELTRDASPDQRSEIDKIFSAAAQLKKIGAQLDSLENFEKAFTRMQIERLEVKPLVQRVVETFHDTAAERNIALMVDVPEDLFFEGDGAKVGMALRNLVENALTFSHESGWVRVRAEALPGFVKFSVIDRGIGISEKEQQNIFEPFYRVQPQSIHTSGPGLGLSIARDMVSMHGGEIWVESLDGMGSTFSFMLPLKE